MKTDNTWVKVSRSSHEGVTQDIRDAASPEIGAERPDVHNRVTPSTGHYLELQLYKSQMRTWETSTTPPPPSRNPTLTQQSQARFHLQATAVHQDALPIRTHCPRELLYSTSGRRGHSSNHTRQPLPV